jgi:site-specific recombinase XerD
MRFFYEDEPMSPEPASPISAHITSATLLPPSIQAWQMFLQDQGRSPHTIKAFAADMLLLASYLSPDTRLGSITTRDLTSFIQWLQTKRGVPCSPKSLSRRITALKSFFRWLHQGGTLVMDPAEKVLQQSVISPLPQVLTDEEVERVLKVADGYRRAKKPDARPYTLLSLLLSTAVKKGECLSLNINHLDLETPDGPILFVRYAAPRNRYKERKIAIHDEWINAYNEYLAQYTPTEKVFPWSQRRLEYLLEDLGKEAGLDKHLSFDMCRWTSALQDTKGGMEKEKIRQKLGVSKIQWREISLKLKQLAGEKDEAEK